MDALEKKIVDRVTKYYIEESRDFNGIPINILEKSIGSKITYELLKRLISSGLIEVHFGLWGHPNPFIKALDLGDTKSQLKQLDEVMKEHDLSGSVFYPTKIHLRSVVDESAYADKPYTLELALGESQLHVRHFQPSIMIQYRDDPRYYYKFEGNCGTVFVKDEKAEISENDEVFLKSFGTGFHTDYDSNYKTSVMCFVYDLASLTPLQQQQWKLKQLSNSEYRIDHAFAQSQIFGSFDFEATLYEAFIAELRIINRMSKAINGVAFLKNGYESYEDAPRNFHRLLIPTRKEYQSYVETLDKLMSDNLNPAFFSKFIPTKELITKEDGSSYKQPIPTIRLLENFFRTQMNFQDTKPLDEMLKSFRRVRSIRSKSAHNNLPDEFDYKYNNEQQKIMHEAYTAVRLIRLALANHPATKSVEVPDWLYEGRIFSK